MNKFTEWFNRVVLNKQPEPVTVSEPYVGPDEKADRLAAEANDLFRAVQEKRQEAAAILESAAQEAREQASALQRRAEEALRLAAERASKAAASSKIADKLNDFIG